jgi:glycosyltransferase involved in cell wall biosynthesis
MISVVIPAHNESAVIGRLLTALLADAKPGELEVIVVPNGCTDGTEAVAKSFGDAVTLVSTPEPSKHAALRLGDRHATPGSPRIYVDADVVLDTEGVRRLADALAQPGVLAAAPERDIPLHDRPLVVRWYYDVWLRLPVVREGIFGRGVIAVSPEAQARIDALPDVIGDDLAASVAFSPAERRVVQEATVVVQVPRTTADLIRRRVRSATGTVQLQAILPAVSEARTSRADLLRLARAHPLLLPKLVVFLGVTVIARRRARKPIAAGDFSTWERDESSRSG